MRALFLSAYNVLRVLTWPLWALWWRARRISPRWVSLHLRGRLEELPSPTKFWRRLLEGVRPPRSSIAELRALCDRVANDPHAHGLVLRLEPLEVGYATLASARGEIARLRAAGKQVVCHLPLEASQRELSLAAACDRVLAMPHAGMSALGPAAAKTYLASLLERIGVKVVVTAAGRYKTAAEQLVRDSMSEPEREQLQAIVRALHDSLKGALAARPSLGEAGADAVFQAGLFSTERAQQLGLVDALVYDDQLGEQLGLRKTEQPVAHARYLARARPLPRVLQPLRRPSKIALVRLTGAIGERSRGASGIDLHGTSTVLRRLAEAERIAGVILYVDSPGGSALVSELLHREIAQLGTKKPVVTWMGNVAASGGYYLASATHAIVAQPTTLTGSIGVISIRPVAARLLELLHVRREFVSLTPFADLYTFSRAPSADEEALLRTETARFYDRFLDVVAQGRGRSREQIAELAEGRVWSGHDAHRHGLVDVLGGYVEARQTLLDLLEPSVVAKLDREPAIIAPARREMPALPPISTPRDELLLALLHDHSEIAQLRDLWALAASGERVALYGLGLPSLR